MSERLLKQTEAPPLDTSALNSQVVQAVQTSNSETAGCTPSQIAITPNMMIDQASGLVAQSAAGYFGGINKTALASQVILLRRMTQNIIENKLAQTVEDALGAPTTDLLVGTTAAVAVVAGATEVESASLVINKIDQSTTRYSGTFTSRGGKDTQLWPPPAGPAMLGPGIGEPSWPISSRKNRSGSIAIPSTSIVTSPASCRWKATIAGRATIGSSMSASGR